METNTHQITDLKIDTTQEQYKRPPYWWSDFVYGLKKIFVYPFQRFFRGYADNDLWNLDYFYGQIITKSLRAFRDKTCSYPPTLTFEEWQGIIDDIIFAFEHESKDWYDLSLEEDKLTQEEKDAIKERVSRGFDYFKEYYRDLWW